MARVVDRLADPVVLAAEPVGDGPGKDPKVEEGLEQVVANHDVGQLHCLPVGHDPRAEIHNSKIGRAHEEGGEGAGHQGEAVGPRVPLLHDHVVLVHQGGGQGRAVGVHPHEGVGHPGDRRVKHRVCCGHVSRPGCACGACVYTVVVYYKIKSHNCSSYSLNISVRLRIDLTLGRTLTD